MGYKTEAVTSIFKGIIIKIGIRIRSQEYTMYEVECADKAVKMTLDRRNKYFVKKKDDQIMNAIISQYGLQIGSEKTQNIHIKKLCNTMLQIGILSFREQKLMD